ncbi:DUF1858 domain-containing protein [Microvirga guangxiensis]|uniref:DUF1858 domain-containing protein n=1 Tax=Microvirga guangxiensis TaxID=549386 RepID=UPI000B80AEDC
MPVEATQLVDDVLRQCPPAIRVFLNHKMRCVGCPIACFHTLDDACREHGVDLANFLAELRATAQSSAGASTSQPELVTARWPIAP